MARSAIQRMDELGFVLVSKECNREGKGLHFVGTSRSAGKFQQCLREYISVRKKENRKWSEIIGIFKCPQEIAKSLSEAELKNAHHMCANWDPTHHIMPIILFWPIAGNLERKENL